MMKDALKKRHKKLVIEVELSPHGEMVANTKDHGQPPMPEGDPTDTKGEDNEIQKSTDLAPTVKDSEEPGVIKDGPEQKDQAKFLEGMAHRMPRPALMDQGSLNARAKRGILDKLSSLKKV